MQANYRELSQCQPNLDGLVKQSPPKHALNQRNVWLRIYMYCMGSPISYQVSKHPGFGVLVLTASSVVTQDAPTICLVVVSIVALVILYDWPSIRKVEQKHAKVVYQPLYRSKQRNGEGMTGAQNLSKKTSPNLWR